MMFRKKRIIEDKDLGSFKWSGHEWEKEIELEGRIIQLSISGTKEQLDSSSINQAKEVIGGLTNYINLAMSYLDKEHVEKITGLGDLLISSISSSSRVGDFDLEFDLKECGYIYVVVHFKNGMPNAVSVGD